MSDQVQTLAEQMIELERALTEDIERLQHLRDEIKTRIVSKAAFPDPPVSHMTLAKWAKELDVIIGKDVTVVKQSGTVQ